MCMKLSILRLSFFGLSAGRTAEAAMRIDSRGWDHRVGGTNGYALAVDAAGPLWKDLIGPAQDNVCVSQWQCTGWQLSGRVRASSGETQQKGGRGGGGKGRLGWGWGRGGEGRETQEPKADVDQRSNTDTCE